MKIATFNINNINKRLQNLLAWLEKAQPDVVCLQELKSENTAFPAAAIKGWVTKQFGKGSRTGTALQFSSEIIVLS
jgi:exodeoxyribonuclease III